MPTDLSCQDLVELVTAYLENDLDPDSRRRFDAHLQICDGCRTYVEQMRQTVTFAGRLQEEDLDPAMLRRLTAAFRGWRDQPPPAR